MPYRKNPPVVGRDEFNEALNKTLKRMRLTRDDLRRQAAKGRFSSDEAEALWFVIRHDEAAESQGETSGVR